MPGLYPHYQGPERVSYNSFWGFAGLSPQGQAIRKFSPWKHSSSSDLRLPALMICRVPSALCHCWGGSYESVVLAKKKKEYTENSPDLCIFVWLIDYWAQEEGTCTAKVPMITVATNALNDSLKSGNEIAFYICWWYNLILETSPEGR